MPNLHEEIAGVVDNAHAPGCTDVEACGKSFEPIPTLDEHLQWVKDIDLISNIEIKSGVYYYEGLEDKVVKLAEKIWT